MSKLDLGMVREWLETLHGYSPGLLGISAAHPDQRFANAIAETIDEAVRHVEQFDRAGKEGIYVRMTTLRERPPQGARGSAEMSLALPCLWADIDIAGPGHKTTEPLPPDEESARKIVTAAGLPEPSRWIHSGGGLYPIWGLEAPHLIGDDFAEIKALCDRWQEALVQGAKRLGFHYASTGDLPRVLRIPGTVNRKAGLARPCVLLPDVGPAYRLADLFTYADAAAAPPPPPEPAPQLSPANAWLMADHHDDGGPGPFDALDEAAGPADVLEPHGWTCGGARSGGEVWNRPGGSSGLSALWGRNGVRTLVVHSTDAGLPSGAGHKLTLGRVFAYLNFGGDMSAAAKALRAAAAGDPTADRAAAALPAHVLDHIRQRCGIPPWTAPPPATPPQQPNEQHDAGEQQEEGEAPPRRLILTPASQVRIRPVRWLWDTTPPEDAPTSHGRIPMNALALAAGGPGLGKSQFGAWLTARVTRGELPGELLGKPRCVIYAASEDSWSYTIAPRLVAAGADMERVFRVAVQDDGQMHARLTLPLDTELLGQAASEYSVALVIADPLLSLIDKSINDYRAAEVRTALEPLVSAADRHHFTILGLAHFTKSGVADPLARVAGSGAFGQLIRSLLAFAKRESDDGDDEFVMSLEKNNLGRLGLPSHRYTIQPVTVDTEEGPAYVSRFVLGEETSATVREAMREESRPDGEREETSETAIWLRDYLTDLGGSDDLNTIRTAAGKARISVPALYRARKKLGVISRTTGFGADKATYWWLPEAAPNAAEGEDDDR